MARSGTAQNDGGPGHRGAVIARSGLEGRDVAIPSRWRATRPSLKTRLESHETGRGLCGVEFFSR
jgi:hypothetical protein